MIPTVFDVTCRAREQIHTDQHLPAAHKLALGSFTASLACHSITSIGWHLSSSSYSCMY